MSDSNLVKTVLGEIDLLKVKNRKLKSIIQSRCYQRFMFSSSSGKKHNDNHTDTRETGWENKGCHSDTNDYSESNPHTDYGYSETLSHNDHSDYSDYKDYSDYEDYSESKHHTDKWD